RAATTGRTGAVFNLQPPGCRGSLLTLTERKSRFELVKKIPAKKAEAVQKAMIELLDSHILRSITPDRGKEFAQHR
ncbi:hypothetical protein SNB13_15905, partial [Escherichia coli]|nr:hypothetical protein [Escherichia coli]